MAKKIGKVIIQAEALLAKLGFASFAESVKVMRKLKLAPPDQRVGIYVHASEAKGEFYVGRANNIVTRYNQHLKNYDDISHTSIKICNASDLSVSEKEAIDAMKKVFPLRNKLAGWFELSKAEVSKIRADMSTDDWLNDDSAVYRGRQHVVNPGQIERYREPYLRAIGSKYFASGEAEALFARYIRTCIPQPALTETLFWTMGCMNNGLYGPKHPKLVALMRLNVAKPEVFTAVIDEHYSSKRPLLAYVFYVSADKIDEEELNQIKLMGALYHATEHKPTKQKLHQFTCETAQLAHKLLDRPQFRRAAKEHNVRLMRHSAIYSNMADAHCLPMTQRLFSLPLSRCRV